MKFCLSLIALLLAPAAMLAQGSATTSVRKVGVGLYGSNGHQIPASKFVNHPHAVLVAVAGPQKNPPSENVKRYATLDELLSDSAVELVSLCSPRRADQVRDAIRCLEAGRHVYAEKPSALTEADLDLILATARRAGRQFHEMAGTAFTPHYGAMRQLVREGAIGEVVQVFVQKSYRYGQRRPQDEAIDGGMFLQAGIHAARLVEHVSGVRIKSLTGAETRFGSPESGDGKTAATAQAVLENGGLATIILNYLNPAGTPLPHGNETLRIFGTKGFIESDEGGARTRLVTPGNIAPLPPVTGIDYFDSFLANLAAGAPMPLTLEEELHPLRLLLRAKEDLRANGANLTGKRPRAMHPKLSFAGDGPNR